GVRPLIANDHTGGGRHHRLPPPLWGRVALVATLASLLAIGGAAAQGKPPTKIWDITLGTPVAALPLDDFVDPACGTNGGPPARARTEGVRRIRQGRSSRAEGAAGVLVPL